MTKPNKEKLGDQKELVDSLSNEEVKSLAALCLRDLVDSDAIEVIEEFANSDSAIAAEFLANLEV